MKKNSYKLLGLLIVAQHSVAGVDLGEPLGLQLGESLGSVLGTSLPLGIGGAAGIAAVILIMGTQLIKRKK